MAHLLALTGISKVFHTEEVDTWALNDIDLTINRGEYVAITGPSGCGKSTLLSILGLLSSADRGTYLLGGEQVSGLTPAEQAKMRNQEIGFIFQAFNLIGDMNVFANVELPLTFGGSLSKKERHARVAAALDQVGMSHRQRHFPSQLSGGQQQRVAIARSLVANPKMLLADEPTGNLDSSNATVVLELLSTLHAAGSTIIMVTHDPRSAEHAQRTISMFDGRIVTDSVASLAPPSLTDAILA